MTEAEALAKMIAPGTRREGKALGGVIQILVTSSCNLSCFSCTQASQLSRRPWFMTPEQFEQAVRSLDGYFGVVGVFGGCPTISPHFEEYCRILRSHVPRDRCGLWANNLMGKGAACRATFSPALSNLNVHLDRAAYEEFRRDWPEARPFGLDQDSRHSPPFVSMRDLGIPEPERWARIAGCKINQHWSAGAGVFRGELRAWFCEIAMAASILHQDDPNYPDTGLDPARLYDVGGDLAPGKVRWWQLPMECFAPQARKHCHDCGVPLQGRGELAQADHAAYQSGPDDDLYPGGPKEQVSATHQAAFRPKRKGRAVELVTAAAQLGEPLENCTRYLQNARE